MYMHMYMYNNMYMHMYMYNNMYMHMYICKFCPVPIFPIFGPVLFSRHVHNDVKKTSWMYNRCKNRPQTVWLDYNGICSSLDNYAFQSTTTVSLFQSTTTVSLFQSTTTVSLFQSTTTVSLFQSTTTVSLSVIHNISGTQPDLSTIIQHTQ